MNDRPDPTPDRLGDFWNAVITQRPDPAAEIDPVLGAVIHRLDRLRASTAPDSAFADRLWTELMATAANPASESAPTRVARQRPPASPGITRALVRPRWHPPIAPGAIATAALLMLVVLGSVATYRLGMPTTIRDARPGQSHGAMASPGANSPDDPRGLSVSPIRWTSEPGAAFVRNEGSPVVADGRVFRVIVERVSGTPVNDDVIPTTTVLQALDAASGAELWRQNIGVFGPPAATLDRVFVTIVEGDASKPSLALVALDAATGHRLWRIGRGTPYGLRAQAPIVIGNTVYTADPDGTVYAVEADTGKESWSSTVARSEQSRSESREGIPPVANSGTLAVGQGFVFIVNPAGDLVALDANTGDERWRFNLPARYGIHSAEVTLIVADDALVLTIQGVAAASQATTLQSVALLALVEADSGHSLWQQPQPVPISDPAIADGLIVLPMPDQPKVIALDLRSGEIRWANDNLNGLAGPPTGTSNAVYVPTDQGGFYALDLTIGGGLWNVEIQASFHQAPALGDDLVVIAADDGTLYAFNNRVTQLSTPQASQPGA